MSLINFCQNVLHIIYRVNHRLAFHKRANKPFIEAPNPYDEKQGWLKDQNHFLAPIWFVRPILPSGLVDIVNSRGGVEDTTFEAKTNNLKKSEANQGQTFERQTLLRQRARMVEAKDQRHNFSELWWANFLYFLNAKVSKILHFVKFLMINRK